MSKHSRKDPHRYDVSAHRSAEPPPTPLDLFHAHLDQCNRCATSPFNLCQKGIQLITAIMEEPKSK